MTIPPSLASFIRVFLVALALLCTGCNAKDNNDVIALTIESYNYTDRPIYTFSVNGNGGGNVFLSTPTNGGGKSVCCVSIRRNTLLPITMEVEWSWSRVEDDNGKILRPAESRKVKAELKGPIPKNPVQFEVHFYPDGHVELAVSDTFSPP